ncbi:Rab23-like protein [Camelus ferus]|nr:Rab23-like protein [Camelus ferus]
MLEEDMEVAIKVVVVGNGAVGKSSMIQRYCKGIFTKDYKKTIGVDFLERQIQDALNQGPSEASEEAQAGKQTPLQQVPEGGVLETGLSFRAAGTVRAEGTLFPSFEDLTGPCEEAEALAKKLKLRFYRTSVKEDLHVSEGAWAPVSRLPGAGPSLKTVESGIGPQDLTRSFRPEVWTAFGDVLMCLRKLCPTYPVLLTPGQGTLSRTGPSSTQCA